MTVLLPALILLLGAPLAVRTRWYSSGSEEQWVQLLDYPYEVRGLDAEVVIFGDSSALTGIDPLQMESETGRKTVVLPDNIHSMTVTRDAPLAAYLSHNKRPRTIVIFLTPWDTTLPTTVWQEGLIMMLRHDSIGHVLSYCLRHPIASLNADINVAQSVILRVGHRRATSTEIKAIATTHGFLPMLEIPGAWPHDCTLSSAPANFGRYGDFSGEVTARWKAAADNVVLYLAPIPNCHGATKFSSLRLEPPAVAGPAVLPPSDFYLDDFQVHLLPHAVPNSTRMLENAIRNAAMNVPPQVH